MRLRVLIVAFAFLGTHLLTARATKSEIVPTREPLGAFPLQFDGWSGARQPDLDRGTLRVLGVDEYLNVTYVRPRQIPVGLYVGYYGSQRQGDTVHSPLNCLPSDGWQPVEQSRTEIAVRDPQSTVDGLRSIEVNRYVIQKGLDRLVVFYWYQAHGRVIASEYWAKFYLIADAIRVNRTDGALVRVISPMPESTESTEAPGERQAIDFVKSMFPLLGRYLPA